MTSLLSHFHSVAEACAILLEALGILIIVLLAFHALVIGVAGMLHRIDPEVAFQRMRQRLGRGILLGLEFLVAADIIHTVAVELNLQTVGVLTLVVLIRTFLSFTMEVELKGRWPWQSSPPGPSS